MADLDPDLVLDHGAVFRQNVGHVADPDPDHGADPDHGVEADQDPDLEDVAEDVDAQTNFMMQDPNVERMLHAF